MLETAKLDWVGPELENWKSGSDVTDCSVAIFLLPVRDSHSDNLTIDVIYRYGIPPMSVAFTYYYARTLRSGFTNAGELYSQLTNRLYATAVG